MLIENNVNVKKEQSSSTLDEPGLEHEFRDSYSVLQFYLNA